MTTPLKLLFDECLSGPLVKHLAALLDYAKTPPDEVKLLVEHVGNYSIHDDVWVPKIAPEGWIVVTGDSGKGGTGKGEKLPFVCAKSGVTHVMFSGKMHQWRGFDKARAFMSVWEEICELTTKPKGSAWLLRIVNDRTVKLVEKVPGSRPQPAKPKSQPPTQPKNATDLPPS